MGGWYSSYLNQFIQPDTLIPDPGNSADWNRYAYVNYNPINFNDPTGHIPQIEGDDPITHWANEQANQNATARGYQSSNEKYVKRSKPEYSLINDPTLPRTVEDQMLFSLISRHTTDVDEHPIFRFGVGCAGSAQFGAEVETGLLFDFYEMEYASYITHSEWGSALSAGGEVFLSFGSFTGSSVEDAAGTSAIVGGSVNVQANAPFTVGVDYELNEEFITIGEPNITLGVGIYRTIPGWEKAVFGTNAILPFEFHTGIETTYIIEVNNLWTPD
jgi:hypothetical protein